VYKRQVLYKTIKDDHPEEDIVEVWLEDGEIQKEVVDKRIIPDQTAPTPDFCLRSQSSLKDIFKEMRKTICDYGAFTSESADPDLIVLGAMASYFFEAFSNVPYYDYTSAEPGVGKTTVMMTQAFMAFNGTVNTSITEAVIFRELEQTHGFYAIDNTEHLFTAPEKNSGICDVLLSSHTKSTYVPRMEHDADGNLVLKKFDCFGIKAFTHIRDIPLFLKPLRERSIQIIMQEGIPKKFHPQPNDFIGIRDAMYVRRLYDFDAVKATYETIVAKNGLPGRAGDLFYSLLSIAKLVDNSLYEKVVRYAIDTEFERKERDPRINALVKLIWQNKYFGSRNSKFLRDQWEEELRDEEILGQYPPTTRSTTAMLRKLGLRQEEKKTDGKKWFVIDEISFSKRAFEYGIIDKKEGSAYQNNTKKMSIKQIELKSDETVETEEADLDYTSVYSQDDLNVSDKEINLVEKKDMNSYLIQRSKKVEMGICEQCGERRFLTHTWKDDKDTRLICSGCADELYDEVKNASQKPSYREGEEK